MFLQKTGLAAVAATGFAILFNVPKRMLGYCAIGGAFAYAFRLVLLLAGIPLEIATFLAAAALSLLSVDTARRVRAHPKAFTVAAMIPMVPGVPFFTTLLAIVELNGRGVSPELLETAIGQGLKAVSILAAIAVGLAVPGMLFYRRRPVV